MTSAIQEFHLAAGESFADAVCPPVPGKTASPDECCKVLKEVLGEKFTPTNLATMTTDGKANLAKAFAAHFECEAPSDRQVSNALDAALVRWPLGSLDD